MSNRTGRLGRTGDPHVRVQHPWSRRQICARPLLSKKRESWARGSLDPPVVLWLLTSHLHCFQESRNHQKLPEANAADVAGQGRAVGGGGIITNLAAFA